MCVRVRVRARARLGVNFFFIHTYGNLGYPIYTYLWQFRISHFSIFSLKLVHAHCIKASKALGINNTVSAPLLHGGPHTVGVVQKGFRLGLPCLRFVLTRPPEQLPPR